MNGKKKKKEFSQRDWTVFGVLLSGAELKETRRKAKDTCWEVGENSYFCIWVFWIGIFLQLKIERFTQEKEKNNGYDLVWIRSKVVKWLVTMKYVYLLWSWLLVLQCLILIFIVLEYGWKWYLFRNKRIIS